MSQPACNTEPINVRVVKVGDSSTTPLNSFRGAAQKIIQTTRATKTFTAHHSKPGDVQGVSASSHDPKLEALNVDCKITCIDYSSENLSSHGPISNDQVSALLAEERPTWASCRWINVEGISWDIIRIMAEKYHLHPLSVEDLLHIPQRTKMDYYENHSALYLTIFSLDEETNQQKADQPQADLISTFHKRYSEYVTARNSIKGPCHVLLEQTVAFMVPSAPGEFTGTLITFFQHDGKSVTTPIYNRLMNSHKTQLRASEDIGFLLQAIIDVVVDHAFAPVKVYGDRISELEGRVLLMPKMRYTRELHLMQGELALLRQQLMPMLHLIHGLREPKVGISWLSPLAITYLGDVQDHSQTIVENIDTMSMLAKNNVDLIFNTIAYETNASMKHLAIISIIFLPITFLAGVYGTNFENFEELHNPSGIVYFWQLCAVVTVLMVILSMMPMLMKFVPWFRTLHNKRLMLS